MCPSLSITICNYNMKQTLPQAFDSARNQEGVDVEILLIDDASTDGSWEYIKTLTSLRNVRVLRNNHREGVVRCRARLLSESRGEFMSVLDADDLHTPEKANRHCALLQANPGAGVICGRAVLVETGKANLVYPPDGFQPTLDLVDPYYVVHSATTWRKSALLDVGGYDLSLTCEECVDLFFKIGDRWGQIFDLSLSAVKRVDASGEFRLFWNQNVARVSKNIMLRTLTRRYGLNKGSLYRRLSPLQASERT